MAIAAQRNKVLDRETNLPVMDFTNIQSNDAYSAPIVKMTKLAESMSKKAEFAESKIKDLMKAVEEAPAKLMKYVQDLMAKIVDGMSKIKLPAFVRNILDKVKSMDLSGFKSFFQRILKVGASLFCNNLDMLMGFFTGYAISKNILSGLLMGLLFSWLNRICSQNSKESLASLSPLGRLEAMTGSFYDQIASNEFLATFITINRNGIEPKYQNNSLPSAITSNSYLASLFSKGYKETNTYLQNAEISDEHKDFIINDSWDKLSTPKPTIATVNDNLLSLTNLPKEEKILATSEYINELGVNFPLTDADIRDITTTVTGEYSIEEREERTIATVTTIVEQEGISPEVAGMIADLNNPLFTQTDRDLLIENILQELGTSSGVSPDLEAMIRDVGRVQLTPDEVNAKLSATLTILSSYEPIPNKESLLLEALGDLKNLPMISEARREHIVSNGNLADKIGNFLKQLMDVDLDSINSNLLNEIEGSFLEKLKELQKTIQNDKSLVSRDNKTGAWMDVDFTKLFPKLSKEEEEYLASIPDLVDLGAHRPLDLHPTSLVLIGEICA